MIDSSSTDVDVAIIGAGLAGTSCAHALAEAGYSVALLDTRAVYPAEFRAEKLGAPHLAALNRLGLANIVEDAATPIDSIDIYRFGRHVDHHREREYGFAYSDVINALRRALPDKVTFLVDRVTATETSADRQRVVLASGATVSSRLLVVSTGLGDVVRRGLGIRRETTSKAHSLSIGFNLSRPADAYGFESLAWYGRTVADRCAYITLFPIGRTMRANLFVYRAIGEDWTREIKRDPAGTLERLLPGIDRVCGGLAVDGPVELRPIDLTETRDHRQPGVVLLGDAFLTTCPAPGVGTLRVLTDVEQLCRVHVPAWFASDGMDRDKIAAFYDDPVKRKTDAMALRASHRSRAMATDRGLIWRLRRRRNALVRVGFYAGARVFGLVSGSARLDRRRSAM